MLERDYIMRLIRQFFEALEKLKEEKKQEDQTSIQLQIHSMYRAYFLQTESFFYEQDATFILHHLITSFSETEYLHRLEMLTNLLCFDASIKKSETEKKELYQKALLLIKHLDTHSNTFSFERRQKIAEIQRLLNQ